MKSQILLKLERDSLFAYSYSGGDEFNEPQLNDDEWKNGFGGRRVLMSQDLSFSPDNTKQEDGLVNFYAKKEDSTYILRSGEIDSAVIKREKLQLIDNKFQTKYSAGGILSKRKFHYGVYEVRFKAEKGKGVWPAFWFQAGYKNDEIDAFELKGEKTQSIHVDTHCPYGCDAGYKNKLGLKVSYGGWLKISNDLYEGFNIMTLEWRQGEILWYINGFPLAYFKGDFTSPLGVFLNTSVAKDGGPFKPGPDEKTEWPNTFSVDYFRAWRLAETTGELKLKTDSNFNISNKFATTYSVKPSGTTNFMYKKSKLKTQDGFISLCRISKNRLLINVTGKLDNKETALSIQYPESKKETPVALSDKELFFDLEPGAQVIAIHLIFKGKEYVQKIILD